MIIESIKANISQGKGEKDGKEKLFRTKTLTLLFAFFMVMLILINGSPYGLAKLKQITGRNYRIKQ